MYRWVDHTSEIELQIEADSERAVFEQALEALRELLSERAAAGAEGAPASFEVEASAPDRPTLLAEWLSELAYLVETEGFLPERADRLELGDDSLEATVIGRRSSPSHLVKAVTYHRLTMEEQGGTWRATVVLDV
jgi:SHS2 domain-containing protein